MANHLFTPVLLVIMTGLSACGISEREFEDRCSDIASIEVVDQSLWQQYLRERKEELSDINVTVDGVAVDPTTLYVATFTPNFEWTSERLTSGLPEKPEDEIYRDNIFIVVKEGGERVATLRNLAYNYSQITHIGRRDCVSSFPHLYTGRPALEGQIVTGLR